MVSEHVPSCRAPAEAIAAPPGRETALKSPVCNLPHSKGPKQGNPECSDWVLCIKLKNKPQHSKEETGEISEFCLVSIQSPKATQVTAKLMQVHQELTWFPVSLPKFRIALQEPQLDPE